MGSTLEDRASARPRAQPAMGSGAVASSATQRATQTSPTTATHPLESLPAVPRSSKLRSKCRRPRLRISLQIPATEDEPYALDGRLTAKGSPDAAAALLLIPSLERSSKRPPHCATARHPHALLLRRMPPCAPGRIREIAGRVTGRYARATISRLQRADPAAAPKARSVSAPSAPDSQSQAPAGPLAT